MAMATADVECVLRGNALNGESPVWSFARSKLFWVDVKGASLHLFDPATGADECWQMPAWVPPVPGLVPSPDVPRIPRSTCEQDSR
jgi:sugar lactone lactonase YvrE